MAEVAAGAVTSLLGVIRSEARLLRLVRSDVQFIKEEMESMNSFLAHLARSAPPGGEHDEQVRTWMNQVRLLAQDCNNCIDLYLYRGNPDIHRARGGSLRRYLWWVYWYLHKLVAQHRAAVRLRELKDRARDVGERRLRYGVEVPSKSAATAGGHSPQSVAGGYDAYAAGGDDEEDGDDDQLAMALLSRTLDDYVKAKILEWYKVIPPNAQETLSLAIVAPDRDPEIIFTFANESLVDKLNYYRCVVFIDIPALHPDLYYYYSSPLRPEDVLYYILRQLKLKSKSTSQKNQGTDQEEGEERLGFWQLYQQKWLIYEDKKAVLCKINTRIENMKIYEKLDKIKKGLKTRPPDQCQQRTDMDQIHLLLKQLLRACVPSSQQNQLMRNKNMANRLPASDGIINAVAEKLKEYVEADEQEGGEGGDGQGIENEVVEEHPEGGKEKVEVTGGGEIEEEEEEEEEEPGRGGEIVEEEPGGGGRGGQIVEEPGGGGRGSKIYLHIKQYIHILRQVFPKTSNRSASDQAIDTTLGEDQIQQMIDEPNQEILVEPQGGKHDTMQDAAGQNKKDDIFSKLLDQTMDKISNKFKEQLKIKGLVDDIKDQLEDKCPLFILKLDDETVYLRKWWEDTRNALSLLACSADALILTTAKDVQQAKEYCYPPECEPIEYSLVGLYYDTVLEITKSQKEENYDPQIFRSILVQCEPYEFCMKMFTHALFFNPKRSNEELNKLHKNLQASPKLFDIIAKKMFMFSYTDMPKEYKSCLLYLAIFPPGHKIRRSTLIGRWVAEGLIFKEDWTSSVCRANRCFDELINRCLVDPADNNGATGKVKSCVVGDLVHGFITKIAKKQHIVETRLSRHLARHFSIFNDLQLRSSDRIDGFFQRLPKSSSQASLLKVLDLEGCQCFGGNNQRYLDYICSKMLLLKYLSLRGTDATRLPSKINDLRELEVLDIRQTKVPPHATANVLLLKLKRLLAGNTDRTPRPTLRAEESVSTAVQIPHKVEKMVNMEVLSNVKARSSQDLKDIGKLCHLRKLGVVVDDDPSHLNNLLGEISDLHECLCSLSITFTKARSQELPEESLKLKHQPKLLESLSISGTSTQKGFLPLFVKDVNNLVKVTFSSTSLNQSNLKDLARLPKLQLISLRHIAFTNSKRELIFRQDEFISLKYLLVEGSTFTKVTFMNGAACMLEKMVLSFTNMESVSGVEGLQKLEEVELTMSMSSSNKNNDTLLSSFNNGKQMAKLTLVGTHEQGDQQNQSLIKFNKGEFQNLRLLTVDCSATKVVFTNGSAPKLEKIVWSSSTSLSLYGIDNLPRLKEIEFNGDHVPKKVQEAIKNHKNKPNLKCNKPKIQGQAKADEQEDIDPAASRLSLFCWKK